MSTSPHHENPAAKALSPESRGDPHERIVIYDDHCGFCQRSVRILRALDRTGLHRFEGSSNRELLEACGITPAEAGQELKLSSGGQIHGGYDAIVEVLRSLPWTSWLAPLMSLPPMRWAGRKVYRRVARGRHCAFEPAGTG